jgi:flagellar biosynthetic protein FliQ
MGTEQVVALGRHAMEAALWTAAPILLVAASVSIAISILQVMTSIQDPTISTVPRIGAAAAAVFVLMHWTLRRLVGYTIFLFSDFHSLVR